MYLANNRRRRPQRKQARPPRDDDEENELPPDLEEDRNHNNNRQDQDDDYEPTTPAQEQKEAAVEVPAPQPQNQAEQPRQSRRRGQPLPNEYIPDPVTYERAWQRNTGKAGKFFQKTCKQNKQLGFMVFFDGRKIGVNNNAEIHFSPSYNLPCNADMVCELYLC